VRVTNRHRLEIPPSALFTKLIGAAKIQPDSPEQRLLIAVLQRYILDLALCGDDYMTKEGYFILRQARLDYKFAPLWFLRFLDLEPDYFRHQIEKNGYMPPIKWRTVSEERIENFGITNQVEKLQRSNWIAWRRKRLIARGILKRAMPDDNNGEKK